MTSVPAPSAPTTPSSSSSSSSSFSSSSSSSSVNPPITRSSISLALVCQSNLNRSMEAHDRMQKNGILCSSYGAGTKVRLPGEAINRPNVYEFGTPYQDIYQDLVHKNQSRYSKNGMLQMVARDRRVKHAPERWQLTNKHYDVVITYEYRVYETVIADLESRASDWHRPCHVINIDTTDNHQEAVTGATLTLQFVNKLYDHSDWCDRITTILDQFEKEHQKEIAHTIMFY